MLLEICRSLTDVETLINKIKLIFVAYVGKESWQITILCTISSNKVDPCKMHKDEETYSLFGFVCKNCNDKGKETVKLLCDRVETVTKFS